ncbi:pro-neuregulin-1, membrane-bound isoform isoform X6 [Erpetoichthys calabaricus]|uniref:pro-neuregulin-1, membrane-bound isoform isoform X6 n=1 Tax=Erpetoichthys calabaricus TaxID=27687 RepID=UPI002234054B|nr:pro-neuregulin-1, membrane-bound isoform isoform X6 [Erpetoichthys calabaricus]
MEMSQGISETSSVPCATPHADQELGLEEVPDAPDERRVLGLAGLTATCCIFMEREQMRSCLHSEKICILPILACLISLALCTAGLKWVFVDKIFEYEPPTHLDPKRIGQDPVVYMDQATEPTEEPTDVYTSVIPILPTGKQVIQAKADPSMASYEPLHRPAYNSPTSALTLLSTVAPRLLPTSIQPNVKGTPLVNTLQTMETNILKVPDLSSTTTPPLGTGHFIGCSEKEKNYCVNGGECFMLNDVPSKIKYLCRCKPGFTGERCQDIVPLRVLSPQQAEELYQKRILTIAGICIALLVVGIMCVVAYCKTKKQRKKLHDRLRQSLRYERNNTNSLANGPHHPNPTTEHVQLAHQYASKSAVDTHNNLEKEMETSFSTSQYTSTTHHSTTVKSASVHSWSNCQTESIITESRSVLVTSSVETSRQTSPFGHRSRLNGTGCLRDVNVFLKNSRDTPESFKDSPYSERYMSAVTTPNRLSPVDLQPPVGPSLPPSEMSPSVSSLATSMPSVAISPFMEEERPLLLVTPPQLREKWHDYSNSNQQRNSAHYNEGHEAHSPPPSPLRIVEDDEYETTQEYEAPAQQPVKKVSNSRRAKRTKTNGHGQHKLESDSDSISVSNSSESETEDERIGEDTPFLSIQNPMTTNLDSAPTFWLAEGSRTNTSQKLSAQDELQARLSGVISNQDPIAV